MTDTEIIQRMKCCGNCSNYVTDWSNADECKVFRHIWNSGKNICDEWSLCTIDAEKVEQV